MPQPKIQELDAGNIDSSPIYIDKFREHLIVNDYSLCTIKAYIDSIEDYIAHGFNEASFILENKYRDILKSEGKKGKTINLRISALNVYNKWVGLPCLALIRVNEDPFAVNGMELDDYFYLLDCLLKDEKYHWYVIIKLLASTGLRIGEATYVTYGDIRKGSCMVYGKGGKPRTILFSHALRETLYMYIKDKADEEKVIPYTTNYVRTAMMNMKKRYHLNVCCSPHEFRRLFARQMYESTHDEALVKGLLGHESISMTSHYIKKTEKQAMRLYARSQNW